MDKLPKCLLLYITNMLPPNDKFNLKITNKTFNKLIKLTITDYRYMVTNNYKLTNYNLVYLKGPDLYYLTCKLCKQTSVDNHSYNTCNNCNSILCKYCVLSCESCDKATYKCMSCIDITTIYNYCCINNVELWCNKCYKQCNCCNTLMDSPNSVAMCSLCERDICIACMDNNMVCYYCKKN